MARVAGYLEQIRQGWYAVVDVPPSLRGAVGRKRLRKSLGTRDKHVARARLPKALLALHSDMDSARRRSPGTDPLTAEALAFRETLAALRSGDLPPGVAPESFVDDSGAHMMIPAVDVAESLAFEALQDREAEIERQEGSARARFYADLATGRVTPLAVHIEDWLAQPGPRARARTERTKMEYRGITSAFRAWLAKEGIPDAIERITRRVAGRYITALYARGLSGQRIRDIASALSGYWHWLEQRGMTAEGTNPWTRQAPLKLRADAFAEVATGPRMFTDDELVTLLTRTTDQVMLDLMRIAALSGMRIEEVCKLTMGRCAGGIFDVPGTKTEAAARKIPIHSELAAVIDRRSRGKAPEAWLLDELGEPDRYGRRSPTIDARFNRYRREVGVHEQAPGQRRSRVTFHSFRRWFITTALRAGQAERVVKQVVGHKLPKADPTTGTYFDGDVLDVQRACVEAVRLPPLPARELPAPCAPAASAPEPHEAS